MTSSSSSIAALPFTAEQPARHARGPDTSRLRTVGAREGDRDLLGEQHVENHRAALELAPRASRRRGAPPRADHVHHQRGGLAAGHEHAGDVRGHRPGRDVEAGGDVSRERRGSISRSRIASLMPRRRASER